MNLKLAALLIAFFCLTVGASILLAGTLNSLKETDFNAKVADLSLINSKLSQEISRLNSTSEELEEKIKSLELEKTQLQSRISEIQTQYDMLRSQLQSTLAFLPTDTTFSGEILHKSYTWTFAGSTCSIALEVPRPLYEYYKNMTRASTNDYSIYVTHPYDDEYLNTIIEKFNQIAIIRGLNDEEKLNLVIAFVQSLSYTVDSVTTGFDEYPRYPVETLVNEGGDCEDTSILAAALIRTMNYEVILINLPNHLAIGVSVPNIYGYYWTKNDIKYYYVETTGEGWKIGQLPPEYSGSSAVLYEVKPIPILSHSWDSKWSGSNLILLIKVRNIGTAIATGYFIQAGLDAGDGKLRDAQSSDIFNIPIRGEVSLTLTLEPTQGYNTRIIVSIISPEGGCVDKSYSNWFDL